MRLRIIGVGNVGLWTGIGLCLHLRRLGGTWAVTVIDPGYIDERAVIKGYPASTLGWPKVDAFMHVVATLLGPEAAGCIHPIHASIQSCPGALRGGHAVVAAVDSFADTAWIAQNTDAPVLRPSTGADGTHSLEVCPPGDTLEDSWDETTLTIASLQRDCLTGLPHDPGAGQDFPVGLLTGGLAVNAFQRLHRNPGAYRVVVSGTEVSSAERPCSAAPPTWAELPLTGAATLDEVHTEAAALLGAPVGEVRCRYEVPLVARRCACGDWLGFERYPLGPCGACRVVPQLVGARREAGLDELQPWLGRSLTALGAPAGLPLLAVAADGRSARAALPYRRSDVPAPLCGPGGLLGGLGSEGGA